MDVKLDLKNSKPKNDFKKKKITSSLSKSKWKKKSSKEKNKDVIISHKISLKLTDANENVSSTVSLSLNDN